MKKKRKRKQKQNELNRLEARFASKLEHERQRVTHRLDRIERGVKENVDAISNHLKSIEHYQEAIASVLAPQLFDRQSKRN